MFHIRGFNQLQVWKYYREKISEISKNQKLILPCTGNYLHGICIVFTAICITFTLYWVLEVIVGWFNIYGMVYLYIIQILQPCYIKDLSICGFWFPVESPRTRPLKIHTKGWLYYSMVNIVNMLNTFLNTWVYLSSTS